MHLCPNYLTWEQQCNATWSEWSESGEAVLFDHSGAVMRRRQYLGSRPGRMAEMQANEWGRQLNLQGVFEKDGEPDGHGT